MGHWRALSWLGELLSVVLVAWWWWAVVVREVPETRYALVQGGGRVAYQAVGDGPVDVLVNRPPLFPVDMMWEEPRVVRFLDRLSSFCRHVWFDPRGTGASDWIAHTEGRLVESFMDDMVAVADDLGCERVAILGLNVPSVLFVAAHPDRTTGLVLADASARFRVADGYTVGYADGELDARVNEVRQGGLMASLEAMAPSLAHDAAFRQWFDRAGRLSVRPNDRAWRIESAMDADLRDVVAALRVPTLVITHRDRPGARQSQYLAKHIDGAKSVETSGQDCLPFAADSVALLDDVEEFLTGRLPPVERDRVLATVLFTDIVDSTSQAARLGDRSWRELLDRHDALVDREVTRFRGRVVKSTGDGVLATFDGPARAIKCACAIRDEVLPLGLEIRAGLHSGEIELQDHDVAGIAVHIGQRVSASAHPNEVLVSRTVADLLAGSDLVFHDRGEHDLKGVPGPWHLFEVIEQSA
jgi:class 3 adenylate cyclase